MSAISIESPTAISHQDTFLFHGQPLCYRLLDVRSLSHSEALRQAYLAIASAENRVVICDLDGPLFPLSQERWRFGLPPISSFPEESFSFLSQVNALPNCHLIIWTIRPSQGPLACFLSDEGSLPKRTALFFQRENTPRRTAFFNLLQESGISPENILAPQSGLTWMFSKRFARWRMKIGFGSELLVDCQAPYTLFYLGDSQGDRKLFQELLAQLSLRGQVSSGHTFIQFPSRFPFSLV